MGDSIHKAFAPFDRFLPRFLSARLRDVFTAVLTPVYFSYKTGHFKSSIKRSAAAMDGGPLPWYTYPCIDFLRFRDYTDKTVVEFGGGQSTLWWAQRARRVITFEDDEAWYQKLRSRIPENVTLIFVTSTDPLASLEQVGSSLSEIDGDLDVMIIDGLGRYEMMELAANMISKDGVIICDDAEAYRAYEKFRNRGLSRVDFFGHAPGVILPHCTSLLFTGSSFVLSTEIPIPSICNTKP